MDPSAFEPDLSCIAHPRQESERTSDGVEPPRQGNTNAGRNAVTAALWRERKILALLLSTLEEQQRQLTSACDDSDAIHTTAQLERLGQELHWKGLNRAVHVYSLSEDWGSGHDTKLREIAFQALEGPWGYIFNAHLEAMTDLVYQIDAAEKANVQLLQARGYHADRVVNARIVPSALMDFLQ